MSKTTTIAEIEEFQWLLHTHEPLRLPALAGTTLSLAAAGELMCMLDQPGTTDLRNYLASQFSRCPVWNTAQRLVKHKRASEGSLVFSRIPPKYDEFWYVQEMRNFRASLMSHRFPNKLSASLTGGVFEIVDNVWRHSGSDTPSLLSYQIRNRMFSFCVADMGIGVLASLRRNRQFSYLTTSVEALEEAVKPSVSRLANGSGLGFDILIRALADLWGQTRLRSGQGVLLFNRETEQKRKSGYFLPHLNGLQVSGVCRLAPPAN